MQLTNEERKALASKLIRIVQGGATAAVAITAFALCGAKGGLQLALALPIAATIAIAIHRRLLHGSTAGEWVLSITATVMALGITLNTYYFTSVLGGTLDAPILLNSDALRYFTYAEYLYNGDFSSAFGCFLGIPIITAALWAVLGKSIVWALAACMALTLVAISLSGRLAAILLRHSQPSSALAMALTAAVCHFTGQGMVLLKEPLIYFAFLLTAIPLAHFYLGNHISAKLIVSFVVGCTLTALVRNHALHFVTLGLFMFLPMQFTRKRIITAAAATICIFASSAGGSYLSRVDAQKHSNIATGSGAIAVVYLGDDSRYDGYKSIFGEYFSLPIAHRIAILPATAAVQYAVPFPWNFERDIKFGYSQALNHISWPWYAIGCIILFYFIWLWRKKSTPLRLWALWAAICWLIPAYLFGGSVSRYVMPFIPILVPLAMVVIGELRAHRHITPFKWWAGSYAVVLVLALTACFFIQNH